MHSLANESDCVQFARWLLFLRAHVMCEQAPRPQKPWIAELLEAFIIPHYAVAVDAVTFTLRLWIPVPATGQRLPNLAQMVVLSLPFRQGARTG